MSKQAQERHIGSFDLIKTKPSFVSLKRPVLTHRYLGKIAAVKKPVYYQRTETINHVDGVRHRNTTEK